MNNDGSRSNTDIRVLLQLSESIARLRLRLPTKEMDADHGVRDRLEELRSEIVHMNLLLKKSDGNNNNNCDDIFLRAQKLLGEAIEERERILEEQRVQEVVSEWKRTAPELNIDNENLECPICLEYLPLDGTTKSPNGEFIYHKRAVCCGKRFCQPCEREFANTCRREQRDPTCPLCRAPIVTTTFANLLYHAEKGKTWAQGTVGSAYRYGNNEAPKDISKALSWHRRAAEKGNPHSQMVLADIYVIGEEGVPKSMKQAQKWFRAAAERGTETAQYLVGVMNRDVRYLTLAAAQGHTHAQCELGEVIRAERSTFPSEARTERAIYWFEKAAKRGHQESQILLSSTLLSLAYARYDAVDLPSYSPIPLALYWARQSTLNKGANNIHWVEQRDALQGAVMEGCGVCSNPVVPLHCLLCNAVYYCGKACQERHREEGHDEDCRRCIVFSPDAKVILRGLIKAPHLNGKVGTIKYFQEKLRRYVVRIKNDDDVDSKEQQILVKPENFHAV
jgi:TPR repeat protein